MQTWKRLTLEGYYRSTLPYRWWKRRRRQAEGRMPIVVVTYHRIADDAASAWTTSNADFAAQIRWLREHFELISFAEAQRRIYSGINHRPAVSITFDDGYAENCRLALPLLVEAGIPFTYFVCVDPVLHGIPFPHDVKIGCRAEPNNLDQLRALARAGVEIGAHTRTHANLGLLGSEAQLHDEVITASEELQAAIGKPVRYFAFPFGGKENLVPRVFHMAYEAGFEGVCSAYGGYNYPGDDGFHIQRVCCDGPLVRLKNWATIDPLRERVRGRFSYELEPRLREPSEVVSS